MGWLTCPGKFPARVWRSLARRPGPIDLETPMLCYLFQARPGFQIRAVVVAPESRRQGQATRLLRALMSKHAGKQWMVPALCPQEAGRLFVRAGFAAEPLTQFQMVRE